jgi:hypothetical protein
MGGNAFLNFQGKMVNKKLPSCNSMNEKSQGNKGQTIFQREKERKSIEN